MKKQKIIELFEKMYEEVQRFNISNVGPDYQPSATKSYYYKIAKEKGYNIAFAGSILVMSR